MRRRTRTSLPAPGLSTEVLRARSSEPNLAMTWLWCDKGGIAYIEQLVLVGCFALAGITALRGLSGAIAERAEAQGRSIADLLQAPGARPGNQTTPSPAPIPRADPSPHGAATPTQHPVPQPSPGPSPTAPTTPSKNALPEHSPPIAARHMGTADGGVLLMENSAARIYLEEKTAQRTQNLLKAGQDHNTKEYGPDNALDVVASMSKDIDKAAYTYGVDRALIAGVIASEVDFDTDWKDVIQNDAAQLGIYGGNGPSIANVHLDSLQAAQQYLLANNLPGADQAAAFAATDDNVTAHPAEAAAIVLAWKTDLKRRAGGSTDSPEDMAVIFATYRVGSEGFDLTNNEMLTGSADLAARTGDLKAKVGSNAYQAEVYFEYYKEFYKAVDIAYGRPSSDVI